MANNIIQFLNILLLLSLLNNVKSQEQSILLRLRQQWQSQPPLNQWSPSSSPSSHCTWPGVYCTNNSVTGLNFNSINITGTVPSFICELKNLLSLDLGNNSFTGTFPSLYNCSKLQYLDLSQNYFVGLLPPDIDRSSQLTLLNLSGNNFSGDIPPAIGRLQQLTSLYLHQNQFNGTFPPDIGNLLNLEYLYMAYNRKFLPSSLPSNFTQLKKLKELWFSQSNLIGEIPEMIGEMVALEFLDLSENGLTGNIPTSLFTLKNLSILYLYKNKLSGEIPEVVETLSLVALDLSDNNLTGEIPDGFGKLEKLSVLSLFFNQLSGEIPQSIGRLPALVVFKLFTNNLSGAIPPEMGRYSMLEEFDVASNRLTGRLPDHLCNGGRLVGVIAFDNDLSGELPDSLGNCSTLEMVSISRNLFSGEIPDGMWTGFNLTYVMISENLFTGELPHEVSSTLQRLEISNNRFSGKIPTGASWRNLVVFNASNNLLSSSIPQELTASSRLTTLLLDRNQLNGSLPSDIISWKSLNTLNVSRNELSGEIPDEFASLPVLSELDLSDNQFSGEIPPRLGSVRPTFLNLSSNHLTGNIPTEFENLAYNESFLNNPGLCTTSSFLSHNLCNSRPEKADETSTKSAVALVASVLAAALALALLLSYLVIRLYHKKKRSLNTTWKFTSFQKLSFTESDILSRLTESNRIGSGGSGKVYRVPINPSGILVAVKKIWNDRKLDQKLDKEFRAEVEILSSIRHVNIVKLLCCISNDDSKLLVYEYLERRSLDQWLHTRKTSQNISGSAFQTSLEWPVRFKIAIGAAQGLTYMHHDCSPPIIHRDVKSSNILLDSDFNAKIADFGLAKMLINKGEVIASSVAGSFGYMAPEYAQTAKVNEKIDVYSYGVVLLELTTGKEANYGDEHTCLADWALRHIIEGRPVSAALDEKIKEASYLDEMSNVFKLGVKCTSKLPSARPSMRQVLQILIQCSHPLVYGVKNVGGDYDATPFLLNSKRADSMDSDDNV